MFVSPSIGARGLQGHIENLRQKENLVPTLDDLQHVVSLDEASYNTFTSREKTELVGDALCKQVGSAVKPEDIVNLQFTSGEVAINLPGCSSRAD